MDHFDHFSHFGHFGPSKMTKIRFFALVNDIDIKPTGISKGPFYYIIGPKKFGNLGDLEQLLVNFIIWAKAASFGQKVKN